MRQLLSPVHKPMSGARFVLDAAVVAAGFGEEGGGTLYE